MALHDRTIFVFGDSLTAPWYSWAKVIEREGFANMMIAARGGLKLTEFAYDSWVTDETPARFEPDTACLFLGTNDALKGVPMAEVYTSLYSNCEAMKKSGLDCTVILPGKYPKRLKEMAAVRREFKDCSLEFQDIRFINMPWNRSQMEDEFHPNLNQHFCWAIHMITHWGLKK